MSSPLHLSIQKIEDEEILVDVLFFLLGKGANVNAVNKHKETPLYVASKRASVKIIQILLEAGAKVNIEHDLCSPFMHAISYGHDDTVKILMEAGIDVNGNHDECSPLMLACECGYENIAKMLIEAGADMEHKDKNGWTALMKAVGERHKSVVQLLLKKGANIEATNNYWRTSLFYARSTPILSMLLEHGANTEARDNCGETPLIRLACFPEYVHLILQYGANVNAESISGETPLTKSIARDIESVKIFLQNGAKTEIRDWRGKTILIRAVEERREKIVRLLLRYGANARAKDQDGKTVLEYAKGDRLISEHITKNISCFPFYLFKSLIPTEKRKIAARRSFHALETTAVVSG